MALIILNLRFLSLAKPVLKAGHVIRMVPGVVGPLAQKAVHKQEREQDLALMQIIVEQQLQNHKEQKQNRKAALIHQHNKNQNIVRTRVLWVVISKI